MSVETTLLNLEPVRTATQFGATNAHPQPNSATVVRSFSATDASAVERISARGVDGWTHWLCSHLKLEAYLLHVAVISSWLFRCTSMSCWSVVLCETAIFLIKFKVMLHDMHTRRNEPICAIHCRSAWHWQTLLLQTLHYWTMLCITRAA